MALFDKGSDFGNGAIVNLFTGSPDSELTYSFKRSYPGNQPWSVNLVEDEEGLLWGTTNRGGDHFGGTIFSYDTKSNTYQKRGDFSFDTGFFPKSNPVIINSRFLAGFTTKGACENLGGIYLFDKSLNKIFLIHEFSDEKGKVPSGTPLFLDGKLFGLTKNGGKKDEGVAFSYDILKQQFHKIVDFGKVLGKKPSGSLTISEEGILFGFTEDSERSGPGTIFQIDPKKNKFIHLEVLRNDMVRVNPTSSPLLGKNGEVFGFDAWGGSNRKGTFFKYNLKNKSIEVLHGFTRYLLGTNPMGDPKYSEDGRIIGLTCENGPTGFGGTLFEYDTSLGKIFMKKDLTSDNLFMTVGSITQGSNGKYYSVSNQGGEIGGGAIFEVDPENEYSLKVVENFGSFGREQLKINKLFTTKSKPHFGSKKYFGISKNYGSNGNGGIWEIFTNGRPPRLICSFPDSSFGYDPIGTPIEVSEGEFIGAFYSGGSERLGSIYHFDSKKEKVEIYLDWKNQILRHLSGSFEISGRKLIGSTQLGIFSLDLDKKMYKTIKLFQRRQWFDQEDLLKDYSRQLSKDKNGNIYGYFLSEPVNQKIVDGIFKISHEQNDPIFEHYFVYGPQLGIPYHMNPSGRLVIKDGILYGFLFNSVFKRSFAFKIDLDEKKFESLESPLSESKGRYEYLFSDDEKRIIGVSIPWESITEFENCSEDFGGIFVLTTGENTVQFIENFSYQKGYLLSDLVKLPSYNEEKNDPKIVEKTNLVYPNPFSDQFFVSEEFKGKFQVLDMNGSKKSNLLEVNQKPINLDLAPGIYIVQFLDENGISNEKIVKQ